MTLPTKAEELTLLVSQLKQLSVPFLKTPNGDKYRGLPDVIIMAPHVAVWLRRRELAGDLSRTQTATYDYLRQCGWYVVIAFGAEEALLEIKRRRSSHGFCG